jgi:hypothetical protein
MAGAAGAAEAGDAGPGQTASKVFEIEMYMYISH